MAKNLLSYLIASWIELMNNNNWNDNKKRELLVNLAKESSNVNLDSVIQYYEEIRHGISKYYKNCYVYKIKSAYRATFGRGDIFGTIPYEIGLSFNWIFNVPVIYGSQIKGAVRAIYRKKYKDDKIFDDKIGFTDAMPISKQNYIIYPEVMTPHYNNVKDETDVTPIPVLYPVVAPNVTFEFIYYSNLLDEKKEKDVREAIKDALILGIGAKTSSGYSYFILEGEPSTC
ncbi:type III-B CRISPR module RAMP protein Cmr6 [Sulfolobus sp. E5-1-F]|uniref:type III-B CRISPR module RAMP protein Cmr6 n=1 Tax=Saccharolobus sp. E5-1-F TaxID=2663019 RepID=UPI001296B65D|nr:type III-B CRISPR module RAMP protein Cmr6 [Sulfolobus sp. E5-1-F]QGA53950.1 type III-B CRISPR module RAMP protein Cmr6 [Sulfolobus sp. E5-1-F]